MLGKGRRGHLYLMLALVVGVLVPLIGLLTKSIQASELDNSKYTIGATNITLNGQPVTEGTKLTFEDTLRVSTPITVNDDVVVNEGDTITFDLPSEVQPMTRLTFAINDAYGLPVANVATDPTSKKVTVTFTDRFNTLKENRTVNVDFDVNLAREVKKEDGQTTITINGKPVTVEVDEIIGYGSDEMINKWGKVNPEDPTEIIWEARVNSNKHNLKGLTIEDKFNSDEMTLLGITELKDVTSWPFGTGTVEKTYDQSEIDALTSKSEGGFVINMGDTEHIIYLKYKTKLKEGQSIDAVSNIITMRFNSDQSAYKESTVQTVKGGGSATGEASDSQIIKAMKTISGRALVEGEFEFELKDQDGQVLQTAKNAADGSVTFDQVKFAKEGVFNYKIAEKKGNDSHITYDSKEYPVKVTVTDDKGVKTASLEYVDGAANFSNSYQADPVEVSLEAKKVLTGRSLKEKEFTFTATSSDSSAPSFKEAKNGADGSVKFGSATFTKAGVYTYSLKEVKGQEAGITYDETEHLAVVTVSADETSGQLSASVVYDGQDGLPQFSNSYQAKPVSENYIAAKELEGRTLKEEEFTFELVEDGKVVATAKNGNDGLIHFPAITYTEVGEHHYIIREQEGTDKTVRYDQSLHRIDVTVSDNGAGELSATVIYDGVLADGILPTFKNMVIKEKPSKPSETKPSESKSSQSSEKKTSGSSKTKTRQSSESQSSQSSQDSREKSKRQEKDKRTDQEGLPSTGENESWEAVLLGVLFLVVTGLSYVKRKA